MKHAVKTSAGWRWFEGATAERFRQSFAKAAEQPFYVTELWRTRLGSYIVAGHWLRAGSKVGETFGQLTREQARAWLTSDGGLGEQQLPHDLQMLAEEKDEPEFQSISTSPMPIATTSVRRAKKGRPQ